MLNRLKQVIDFKNFLLILGVIAFMAIIGIVLPSIVYEQRKANQKAEDAHRTPSNQTTKQVSINYSNKGFSPKNATITSGTTIVWTNNSDKQMWVASDPHPAHNNLPGFDQTGSDAPDTHEDHSFLPNPKLIPDAEAHAGGHTIYKYTFTQPGTHTYHNHLSPNDRGAIIVE